MFHVEAELAYGVFMLPVRSCYHVYANSTLLSSHDFFWHLCNRFMNLYFVSWYVLVLIYSVCKRVCLDAEILYC
jgi:hypothetical protein